MLQSTLKSRTPLSLVVALASGAAIACTTPAASQYSQGTWSPTEVQTLGAMLREVPPYEQVLVVNAVRALGPARAEMPLYRWRAARPADRAAFGQFVSQILQQLPPEARQTFMNGIFGVSPQDEQYVAWVASIIERAVRNDVSTAQAIAGYGATMRDLQRDDFQRRQDLNLQQSVGMGGALGASSTYNNPFTGQPMGGWTPLVGQQAYACPGYPNALNAPSQPVFCQVAPSR